MKPELIILISILGILLIYIVIVVNKLIKLKNMTKEAFSTMDIYLKKRWDLIPNIVETVKGYSSHEEETLTKVVELRNNNYDNMNNIDKIDKNEELNSRITKLMALAEAYPELKANKNYLDLQKELKLVEDEIAKSRKYYNGVVKIYNNKVEMIPSNIVAKLFGYKPMKMFEATSEERENVKVNLNER